MARASILAALIVTLTGCAARQEYNYSYPDYPYVVHRNDCGSASPEECAWARAKAQQIAEENAAAAWGSVVALTMLASIDVEPDR